MPLVDIQLIEGVFSADQKRQMIEKVTDTLVAIEGEAMRGVTWVRVQEFASGAQQVGKTIQSALGRIGTTFNRKSPELDPVFNQEPACKSLQS